MWEYKVITPTYKVEHTLELILDKLGDEGWELVTTVEVHDVLSEYVKFIFKRPKVQNV